MSPDMLTLVAAVLAYDRVERASDICERRSGRSGRSEFRYAMSETSEEKDMAGERRKYFVGRREVFRSSGTRLCKE
jgi:hypothetical protein